MSLVEPGRVRMEDMIVVPKACWPLPYRNKLVARNGYASRFNLPPAERLCLEHLEGEARLNFALSTHVSFSIPLSLLKGRHV